MSVALTDHFHLVAQAPGGVKRLRELILTLAVQLKVVAQNGYERPADSTCVPSCQDPADQSPAF